MCRHKRVSEVDTSATEKFNKFLIKTTTQSGIVHFARMRRARPPTAVATWRTRPNIASSLIPPHWIYYVKVTTSTKPKLYNALHCRQSETEPRPQLTCRENLLKCGRGFRDMRAERQGDRQTHSQTFIHAIVHHS